MARFSLSAPFAIKALLHLTSLKQEHATHQAHPEPVTTAGLLPVVLCFGQSISQTICKKTEKTLSRIQLMSGCSTFVCGTAAFFHPSIKHEVIGMRRKVTSCRFVLTGLLATSEAPAVQPDKTMLNSDCCGEDSWHFSSEKKKLTQI